MIFDWKIYRGNLDWLESRTIYLTKYGSHAYGTNTPESDLDVRGVCIAPKKYYFGSGINVFEQAIQTGEDIDLTVTELRKFIKLASECNPSVIEILFTDPSDHLFVNSMGQKLLDNRNLFLSKKARHTFAGYAKSQANKMASHYYWLTNPVEVPPTREEFGLEKVPIIPKEQLEAANAAIQKKLDEWSWREMEHIDPALRQSIKDEFYRRLTEISAWSWNELDDKMWKSAAKIVGLDKNFIKMLQNERTYKSKVREYDQYQEWKKNRNPKRAELEKRTGYDCKNASQLVRLLRTCREILTTGEVNVRRPDAKELLDIRNGAWTYEYLLEWFEKEDKELAELYKTSKLPHSPDLKKIDELCIDLVEMSFGKQM